MRIYGDIWPQNMAKALRMIAPFYMAVVAMQKMRKNYSPVQMWTGA
jgi:hypothetical protein